MKKAKFASLLVCVIALFVARHFGLLPEQSSESKRAPREAPSARHESTPASRTASAPKVGNYEVFRSCSLIGHKHNDGDSFHARLPDGRDVEFRLCFVDTPESAFKSYGRGESNHQRIAEQARYFNITPEQAVEIGQRAKHFTHDLLERAPFTVYTAWDDPFGDHRYHAHIEVMVDGKPRWLHELLVEQGFVRVYTKPADLPDGTPAKQAQQQLREKERKAKQQRVGAWGM